MGKTGSQWDRCGEGSGNRTVRGLNGDYMLFRECGRMVRVRKLDGLGGCDRGEGVFGAAE